MGGRTSQVFVSTGRVRIFSANCFTYQSTLQVQINASHLRLHHMCGCLVLAPLKGGYGAIHTMHLWRVPFGGALAELESYTGRAPCACYRILVPDGSGSPGAVVSLPTRVLPPPFLNSPGQAYPIDKAGQALSQMDATPSIDTTPFLWMM